MAKTKYFLKIRPKMVNFLFIFVLNLKWLATGGKTLKFSFVTPEVNVQP